MRESASSCGGPRPQSLGSAAPVTAAAWPCAAAHPIGIFIGGDSFPTSQSVSQGRRGAAGQPQKNFDVDINSPDHEQSVHKKGKTKSQ